MAGNTATINVAAFRADWMSHAPMRALCERWEITRDQVIRLKHVWSLPPRHDRKLRAKPTRHADPSPSAIKRACLEIQSQWTDDVREQRRVTKTEQFFVPRVEMTDEARQAYYEWCNDGQ